jgi:hypothetical protein
MLMTNAKLLINDGAQKVSVHCREAIETDETGRAFAKHSIQTPCFVYDKKTGEKI